ncbi:MAG: efflux RND transporter permease subunit, partial [Sphingobacteriaceae bacterium]|nr:efflux RND transporter permease subunit [Sphingobacteriaceae bacterium]
VTKIGSGEVPTDPMPMEAGDMMVILKDKKEWTSAHSFDELSKKMTAALENVPGITVGFQYPVQMRFNELMTGARQDVVCKIFGENLDSLALNAEKIGTIVSTVEGAENLFIEPITGVPQIIINYNRAAIAQYNLSISEINKVINTAFAGQSTGLVFEDEKRFDLVVKLNQDERKNLVDVQNLLIPTANGNQIPLNQLAEIAIKSGPNQIQREDTKRRIVVGFNVKGRDVQSIVQELQTKVNQKIKLPTGYYVTYGGAFENLNQAKQRLMIAVPVSLILIFILLFFTFKSIKQGLLIYTAIPLSAIGGILFLALRGMPFSISAGIGFIALFGVAVLNGIVLVSEFNRLKESGIKNKVRIVLSGTKLRLRPVLMTAFVASLGFLPMALSDGAGAEVQRPLATVVIGGLLIATFLTLFVLPILYLIFEKEMKTKLKFTKKTFLVLFLIGFALPSDAQQKINIKQALEIALANNKNLKIEKLKADYAQALIKTSTDIAKTNVFFEGGKINSLYNDTKFGLSQSLAFPSVYKHQKHLFTAEWQSAVLQVSQKENELKKMVNEAFYSYIVLQEREKILQKADSLYSHFLEKSILRLAKGETNILEKLSIETQKHEIENQIRNTQQSLKTQALALQYFLNSPQPIVPEKSELKLENLAEIDTNSLKSNFLLKIANKQKDISLAQNKLEKSKFLPDFNFGYNNNSFVGLAPNNQIYTLNNRFSSFQIGVSIPLFMGSRLAKIKSTQIAQKIALSQYENEWNDLKIQQKKWFEIYKSNLKTVLYFEQSGLKNATVIIKTANKQFINGEIGYIELISLINQSFALQSNYLDALTNHNESIIQLNFLSQK